MKNVQAEFEVLLKIASEADEAGNFAFADDVEGTLIAMAKKRPDTAFIIPPGHPKNKSKAGHYPIPDEAHGRNALSRVNQTKKAPPWWSGSVKELVSTVVRAVHKKFPKIQVSEKSKKPGKG